MDWLTFISKITEALAWPLATVVILIALRKHLARLIPLLKRVKAGPLEAEFERELRDLRKEAAEELPPVTEAVALDPLDERLQKLAEINPRSAILEAWQQVEAAARKRSIELGIQTIDPERRPRFDAYRELARAKILNLEGLSIYQDLRALRNQAAHVDEFNPTKAAALDYIALSKRLITQINGTAAA